MLISDFNEKIKMFKKMKAPLITSINSPLITPNLYDNVFGVIGAFDDFNVIRIMELDRTNNSHMESMSLLNNYNWLNLGITTKDDLAGTIPSELIPMINGPVIRDDDRTLIYIDVNKELNKKYEYVLTMKNSYSLLYENQMLSDDMWFQDTFLNFKASDGAVLYKVAPHICMTLYKGLIPYAKGDKIVYNIYCDEYDFLTEFITIRKSKSDPDIKTYVRYLYV